MKPSVPLGVQTEYAWIEPKLILVRSPFGWWIPVTDAPCAVEAETFHPA